MKKTIDFIKSKLSNSDFTPEIGLILGSGLGDIAEEIEGTRIPYNEIPGFSKSTVEGHAGQLVIGTLKGQKVVAMQGRFHFYEGHSMSDVVFPVKVMKKLGIEKLFVTNAAGGINTHFSPGDLMLITDHINFTGTNPLIGKNNDELGPRFHDMSNAYDKDLRKLTEKVGIEMGMTLQKGVYIGLTGPSYETPAEIRMLRVLGADAVGMSTVPEVIVANHMGIKVLGISCITNMAAGILEKSLSHDEVLETTNKVKHDFIKLAKRIIENL